MNWSDMSPRERDAPTGPCRKCGCEDMRPYGAQGRRYCPECKRVRYRRHKKNGGAQKFNDYRRDWQYRDRYGITLEEFNVMRERQGGRCAICHKPDETKKKRLHVDHCHDTGEIRGLLCGKCNVGLSNFRDDPEVLRSAIAYLNAALRAKGVEV